MTTYVFAWNPRLWNWPELARERAKIARRGHADVEWACGRIRAIEPGSRAFFVRVGRAPKGLIASGFTLTEPREGAHWLRPRAKRGVRSACARRQALFPRREVSAGPRRSRMIARREGAAT